MLEHLVFCANIRFNARFFAAESTHKAAGLFKTNLQISSEFKKLMMCFPEKLWSGPRTTVGHYLL
jgi:hypothetical protein